MPNELCTKCGGALTDWGDRYSCPQCGLMKCPTCKSMVSHVSTDHSLPGLFNQCSECSDTPETTGGLLQKLIKERKQNGTH